MPDHLRCVVTHLYLCDRSFEDVAQLMGIPCSAVKSLHDRALANLRARIRIWR